MAANTMGRMRIGIIGAGNIGGGIAEQSIRAGHEVLISFSRDQQALGDRARKLGASSGTPADAAGFGDIVVLSVPWGLIDEALRQAGALKGRIVVDTTNQFGPGPKPPPGQTAAAFNAARMPGARYVKSFNTLTAGFQAQVSGRTGSDRVVQWLCGDDADAKTTVARLIQSLGFTPVDLGGNRDCAVMEAPRRPGAVYGEEYRAADAAAVVEAVRAGKPIPPVPVYAS
jgi:predicted dinucleotide-binding enzyme